MEAAVVSAAHGAMGSLLGKLGQLLAAKYKLLKEAQGEIMFLKAELESMGVFLNKISDTEDPDEQDKCWAKEVRELSYDIEDSVSEFMLRVECESDNRTCGFKGFIERCMNLLTTMNTRYEIAKEFQGLKRRVIEVSERRTRYKIDDVVLKPNNTTIDLRLLALHTETASLVGVKGPRDQLIRLMDEEGVPAHQLKVLSIVGFGGLGKTTLANEIYRKLEGKFHCRAFASVSQKPNIRKILRTLLSQVGFVTPNKWEESELITALQRFLLDKRYLIVIDDIWDASAWDIIRCALPENMNGSRVITTTRIEAVARACCTNHNEYVYKMKALSDTDSRSLFFKRIFGSDDTCPLYLNQVSAEILKKCGGLPLAIITISSMLANQPNKLKKEQWEDVRNSLGSNFEMSPSLEGMRQILNLSYINLPHYLKTCMLYIGIYPEDYTIDRNELTRQWLAEGFVCKARGTDPEDIAKIYFNELINRSMIQPTAIDNNGEVMSCRVHDMMLDLILAKCGEDNFISVIDDIQEMAGQQDKNRRLSLNLDGAINDTEVRYVQLSQTRTLARFGICSELPPFKLFKHLRVLVIKISSGHSRAHSAPILLDFTGICHLFQLRFLQIVAQGLYRVVLPSKIGDLRQLETFEVNAAIILCEQPRFQGLPTGIVALSRLLHLTVPSNVILPDGIGNMKSLCTLRKFYLDNSIESIKGLRELTNLTALEIRSEHYTSSGDDFAVRCRELVHALGNLCNLKYLHIVSDSHPAVRACLDVWCSGPASFFHLQSFHAKSESWFSRVPAWIGQQQNLYDLNLVVKEVLEDDIDMLAQLSSLMYLRLHIKGAPKDKIIILGGSGFPFLKHFRVDCCRISYLTFELGAMPKLEKLELVFNAQGWERYVGAAPAGIEHLSALKEISVDIGGARAKESNRRAAESALRNAVNMHPGRPVAVIKDSGGMHAFDDMFDEVDEKKDEDGGSSSRT